MNSKDLMIKTFMGERTARLPAALHWWGMYKFQLAGLCDNYDEIKQDPSGKKWGLEDVDAHFYDFFKPDWFHLGGGAYKTSRDKYKTIKAEELKQQVGRLKSKDVIDEFLDVSFESSEEIKLCGTYDHVRVIVEKYGSDVFIALNEGSPIGGILDPAGLIGFEEGLVALVEKPDFMEYLIFCEYDRMLERIHVLKEYGCHAYIGSETYCSPDLISPATYKDIIFPAQKHFYKKVKEMGIIPIVYFLGDINPHISCINELDVTALMVEESKKTFSLDVMEIRKKLREDITLFGNLDSVHTLLWGTVDDVVSETKKQLSASRYGRFVMANGSPIALDTPVDNIMAMIETVYEWR